MIAEIILITELLRQTVGTPNSTSRAPSPRGKSLRPTIPRITIPDVPKPVTPPLVINVTPEQVAIYKESERVKKQLRGL